MALSSTTFSNAGGAVSDIFAGIGATYKAKGLRIEQGMYQDASQFATQNEQFTEQSQAIKQAQLDRSIYQSTSGTEADIGGSGLARSGSGLDILADSASHGALTKAVLNEQGLITEAGYEEQSKSYAAQAEAAGVAAEGADTAAIGAGISGVLKGVAAVASIAAAPATGGLSLAAGGLFMGGGSPSGYGSGS